MSNSEDDRFPIEITRVVDGDGFEARVLDGSDRMIDVRLYAIDAPESDQTYGRESMNHLRQLAQDGRFWLEVKGEDPNGRTVGVVYKDSFDCSRTLNYLMVSSGWAYWYSHYEHGEDELGLRASEASAYMEGTGVWQKPDLERPWDFKERKRQEAEALAEEARQAALEQARRGAYKDTTGRRTFTDILKIILWYFGAVAVFGILMFFGVPWEIAFLLFFLLLLLGLVAIILIRRRAGREQAAEIPGSDDLDDEIPANVS